MPRARRKGIIANPNCTTMAAMPVLKPLHDEAGLRAAGRRAPTRRCPAAGWPASTSSTSRSAQVGRPGHRAGPRRRRRSTFPAPEKYVAPIAFNVAPAGRLDRRRRLVRDRRGAEAPQREPQDPRHPRPARVRHLRAGAGVHRSLAVDQRRVRPAALGRARATELLRRRAGRRAQPTCRRRCRPPARTRRYVGRIRQDPGVPDGRGLALFVSNDNLRKGAALNAVQIAELVAAAPPPLPDPPAQLHRRVEREVGEVGGWGCRCGRGGSSS